jgi:dihydroorotate dehydrogenase
MGFPNVGLESAARRLEPAHRSLRGTPLVVSVSGLAAEEVVRCHRRLEPLADAIEVNISSPNTAGLRLFHEPRVLAELIDRVNEGRSKPLWVKMPPYPPAGEGPGGGEGRDSVLALARACIDGGVDAITVANSRPTGDARLSTGSGGLSGKAVFPDTVRMVSDIRSEVGDGIAINACGGIFSPEDAWMVLRAGASTVQLYTGLVYRGPGVVRQINRGLLSIMEREGVESLGSAAA